MKQKLVENWKFKQTNNKDWLSAKVPGCVHTDLLKNDRIEDPFYRDNERKLQWIGKKDWQYRTTFHVKEKILDKDKINLIFKGLDTYADVNLNGEKILEADNMFREWNIDAGKYLHEGENELEIYFHSVFKVNRPKWEEAPFRLQAFNDNDQAEVKLNMYSRKAGFHYGWDWGPRLVTAGIWRPVYIEAWDTAKIKDLQVFQTSVTKEKARLNIEYKVEALRKGEYNLDLLLNGEKRKSSAVKLDPGINNCLFNVEIEEPDLWWTNGLGDQNLYEIEIDIKKENELIDKEKIKTGLRDIEVIREEDEQGKSLYIELNGEPLFIKGANYIPQDNFQDRVSRQNYEELINSAAEAHMNMLRVWGGGIYEEDEFYEMCDQKGILIWQDMMFACGMYPANQDFLKNVAKGVRDNVKRLRNHPSIALWCGNNENKMAWYQAGWKEKYPPDIQQKYEQDMSKLFETVIPRMIQKYDPGRYYQSTSPIAGFGDIPMEERNVHYWGVWHGQESIDNYEENIGRFMTEWGMQSFPDIRSVEKFTRPKDRETTSQVMLAHQRCRGNDPEDKTYGNRLIKHYMDKHYREPKDFTSHLYLSQLIQAKAVKTAIEAHRRNKPYCMGTLYWQLNDCWPAISWSSIDYYGHWKAAHYTARDRYKQVILSINRENDFLEFYIVSDLLKDIQGDLIIEVCDFDGNKVNSCNITFDIQANSSQQIYKEAINNLIKDAKPEETVIQSKIIRKDDIIDQEFTYLKPEKELDLRKPNLGYTLHKINSNRYSLELSTESLARDIWITTQEKYIHCSDNYFDLLPGQTKTITFESAMSKKELENKIVMRSLFDSYE